MGSRKYLGKMFMGAMALAVAGSVMLSSGAQAAFMIEISDGITTKTYTDNQLLADLDPRTGALLTNPLLGVGNFTLAMAFGVSKPFVGDPSHPVMDMAFSAGSFGAGGTLTIKMTDTDFLISGLSRGSCGIGGVSGGSVSTSCYYDSGNVAFAETVLLGEVGSVVGEEGFELAPNGLISLTTVVRITHGNEQLVLSSGNTKIVVPEPQALALFGIGLLGLGFLARRRAARHLDG